MALLHPVFGNPEESQKEEFRTHAPERMQANAAAWTRTTIIGRTLDGFLEWNQEPARKRGMPFRLHAGSAQECQNRPGPADAFEPPRGPSPDISHSARR